MTTREVAEVVRHGGDLRRATEEYGGSERDWLDFSSSVCRPALPERDLDAVWESAARRIGDYPDPEYQELRGALAKRHGVAADEVWPLNGSSEAIFAAMRLVVRGSEVAIPAPSFREYARCARSAGARTLEPIAWGGGVPDAEAVIESIPSSGAIVVGYPNSPTGESFSREEMTSICNAAADSASYCVVDEAFQPFSEVLGFPSLASSVADQENLVVIRSLTKSHGLAGIRFGYTIASPEITRRLAACVPAWSVSRVAEEFALRLESFDAVVRAGIEEIMLEQRRMFIDLGRIPGLRVLPSVANFFLCQLAPPKMSVAELQRNIAGSRILIRRCDDYPGLSDRHFRVAVRRRVENDRLLDALRQFLA